jgi:metallophosphoesterase superfamily enzyme
VEGKFLNKYLSISDMHLGSKRSYFMKHEKNNIEGGLEPPFFYVYEALKYKKIDYLVINGDAVELDWGSYYSFKKVMIENAKLFKNLSVMFPKIKIIYILGNHDGYIEFYQILTSLAETTENFEVKPSFLRLGNTLFHHGDLMVKLGNELYRDKGDLKKIKNRFYKKKT